MLMQNEMKHLVDMIDGHVSVMVVDENEKIHGVFVTDQSIIPKIEHFIQYAKPDSEEVPCYPVDEADLISELFAKVPDVEAHNLRSILDLLAQDKTRRNTDDALWLANYCFYDEIDGLRSYVTEHQEEKLSPKVLASFLNGIKHRLAYVSFNKIQTIFAIELLCLRTGKYLRPCQTCGKYFISNGNKAYCSDECLRIGTRQNEKKSHDSMSANAALWRKIQGRLMGRIRRQPNQIVKSRLQAEYDAILEEKEIRKDTPQYTEWLKRIDARTRKDGK